MMIPSFDDSDVYYSSSFCAILKLNVSAGSGVL